MVNPFGSTGAARLQVACQILYSARGWRRGGNIHAYAARVVRVVAAAAVVGSYPRRVQIVYAQQTDSGSEIFLMRFFDGTRGNETFKSCDVTMQRSSLTLGSWWCGSRRGATCAPWSCTHAPGRRVTSNRISMIREVDSQHSVVAVLDFLQSTVVDSCRSQ